MTIKGDLEAGLWEDVSRERATAIVRDFFDYLTTADVISFLSKEEFDADELGAYLAAIARLKAKCLTNGGV